MRVRTVVVTVEMETDARIQDIRGKFEVMSLEFCQAKMRQIQVNVIDATKPKPMGTKGIQR